MLKVRASQMEALAHDVSERFEGRLLEHVGRCFPGDYRLLGEPRMRAVIRRGRRRAEALGFFARGEICRFIDLTFALGGSFDRDPLLPWARPALAADPGGERRMDRLHAAAIEHLRLVHGEEGQRYTRALLRARRLSFEEIAAPGEAPAALLGRLFPEKMAALGGAAPASFLRLGAGRARQRGLAGEGGLRLYLVLMFLLGSDFAQDPQFPWAAAILDAPAPPDPIARARALHRAALDHLEAALALHRAEAEAEREA